MYKVENKSIEISTLKSKNRILDNYLDWIIFVMLPNSIGPTLFPKFAAFGIQNFAMEQAYVEVNTPQVITDSSVDMAYEKAVFIDDLDCDEVVTTNGKIVTVYYPDAGYALTNGDTFEGIGFGRAEFDITSAPWVADYLLAYMDVSASQLIYNDTNNYALTRVDEISTDEKLISGDFSYLPGKLRGTLVSISMCYSDNGLGYYKEYHYTALTFTVVGVGNVSVTGFDDFFYEDGVIYPKTDLYPATDLYPTQPGTQIKSVRFKYQTFDMYGGSYSQSETYINIKDLDVTYNNTDMSINLVCERG